jgi:hypothetical protein
MLGLPAFPHTLCIQEKLYPQNHLVATSAAVVVSTDFHSRTIEALSLRFVLKSSHSYGYPTGAQGAGTLALEVKNASDQMRNANSLDAERRLSKILNT